MGGLSEPNVVLGFRGLEFRIWGFVEVVRDLGGLLTVLLMVRAWCPLFLRVLCAASCYVVDHAVLQTSLLACPWASCNRDSLVYISGSPQ